MQNGMYSLLAPELYVKRYVLSQVYFEKYRNAHYTDVATI